MLIYSIKIVKRVLKNLRVTQFSVNDKLQELKEERKSKLTWRTLLDKDLAQKNSPFRNRFYKNFEMKHKLHEIPNISRDKFIFSEIQRSVSINNLSIDENNDEWAVQKLSENKNYNEINPVN